MAGVTTAVHIAEISGAHELAKGATAPSVELGKKFEALMQQPAMAPPLSQTQENMLQSVVAASDDALQANVRSLQDLSRNIGSMPMPEMIATWSQLAWNLNSAQIDLTMKVDLVQSSTHAVETLMKNQ